MAEEAKPLPFLLAPVHERPVGTNPFKSQFWLGRIDLRGMALFRIIIGLFCIYDLLDFSPNLRAFFSDDGIFPRTTMLGQWARATRFCLLDSFGNPTEVWIYWAIALFAAAMMTLGYLTRFWSIVVFIFIAGFQERLPVVFDGSDSVLNGVLFWHIFTRSGAVWSVDAELAKKRGRPPPLEGPALPVRLVGLQVCWVYFCSIFYKAQGVHWADGTALHYALHTVHVFAHGLPVRLADVDWAVKLGSWFTLLTEGSFLVLMFSPFKPRICKVIGMLEGTALHAGIYLSLAVGNFSTLMPLTFTALFEGDWAQWVVDKACALLGAARVERMRALARSFPVLELAEPTGPGWIERNRGWSQGALALWFGLVSWYALPHPMFPDIPRPLGAAVEYASLWGTWSMFAPEPLMNDYRVTAPAEFEDGTKADLFLGANGQPNEVEGSLTDRNLYWFTRWWKYVDNVVDGNQTLTLEWGRYICRERNFHLKPGEPRLYTFAIEEAVQDIPPNGLPWPPTHTRTLWSHRCFDKPSDVPKQPKETPPPSIAAQTPAH